MSSNNSSESYALEVGAAREFSRPIGFANTRAYALQLWTHLITSTPYKYAEVHSLLGTMQAGSCNPKDTIHQLQNVIMSLKDAKSFKQDINALIVDFTSAFNTTDHDRMLWNMYDPGFPTDAIDTAKNLYEDATTLIRHLTPRPGVPKNTGD
eukprot:1149775-Pelagomonas_calceolata.AAC.2